MNIKIIRTRIEFDQQMIREHDAFRNEVSATLRDIERTLDDQKRIKDVLDTEIRPTLAKLKDEEDKWKAAVEKYNLNWLHVYNPRSSDNKVLRDYAIQGFPTKILVGPDGKIVKTIVGEDPAFYTFMDETFGK